MTIDQDHFNNTTKKEYDEAHNRDVPPAPKEGWRERREELFEKGWFPRLEKFVASLLAEERGAIIQKIKDFNITSGIHGEPVNNPLMRLEEVKNLFLASLEDDNIK